MEPDDPDRGESFAMIPGAYGEEVQGGYTLGIESMQSHTYSVGIFIFMMIAIVVFVGIVFAFLVRGRKEKMKRGEKVMLAFIILGVVVASWFAAIQLLEGYLF